MSKTLSSILQKGTISVARGGTGTTTSTGSGSVVLSTSPNISTSLTTSNTSFNLINTNATTINFGGAATSIVMGTSTGLTKINHDLQVEGNIYYNGTANQLSATNLSVNDALIYLAANNTADLLDIGIMGRYNNGVNDDTHTGLVRDATDRIWKLFSNVTEEPTTTVNFTGATYDTLQIGNLLTTKVNNVTITQPATSSILTIVNGSSLITSGAYSLTLTTTADSNVTFPTTGTLVNTSVTTLSSLTSVGTINTGTWSSAINSSTDATIHTLTIGLGANSIATNTVVGYQGLSAVTTGATNTAVGYQSLTVNTTGTDNTSLGNQTLLANISGNANTAIGSYTLIANTGNNNTAIGAQSLKSNTSGAGNVAIGYFAGYANSANANTTGSNNIYLGYNTVGSAVGNSNEIVIGASAVGLGSNTTVIGTSGTTTATTIYGSSIKFPGVATSGFVKIGAGGVLSNDTTSYVSAALTIGTTGTDVGSTISSGVITLNIPTASASNRGALSAADWSTFNNKVSSLSDTLTTITARGATTSTASSFTGGLTVGTSLSIPAGDSNSRPTAVAGNLRFNTTLGKFEGYSGTAWGAIGGGGGLTPTAIKTANYTAVANDLVRCNTTSGAFSITLPASPTDGDMIGVIDIYSTFATNNLTILPNGNKIESDTTSLILDVNGSYVSLVYNSATTNWKIQNTPLSMSPSAGLIPTPIKTSAYTAAPSELVRCNTTSSAFNVTMPNAPTDGTIVGIIDIYSTFATNNLTVLPNSGATIESDTSLVLDISGSFTTLVYTAATTNWKLMSIPIGVLGNVSTSVTLAGIVKGTGTNLTNATAGTDFSAGTSSLATGILKSTTTTGALTIAVAADFPTLNQNTTGTAAGLSTTLAVGSGGTGATSLTANNVLLGNGTSAVQVVAPGTSGNILTSNGTTWTSAAAPITLPSQSGNNGKYLTTDGSTASWATIAVGLSPTAIKTANYTAVANELVRCNTTSSAFNVTLPASPTDGTKIGIVDVTSTFGTNAITLIPSAGTTVEGDATAVLLDMNNTYAEFVYNASTTNWKLLETPIGLLGNVSTAVTLAGIVKGTGTNLTNATAGTDYQAPIGTISGVVKGNGANALTAATAGTDFVAPGTATTFSKPQTPSTSSETTPSTNAITWDLTTYQVFRINLNANITTFTLTGTLSSLVGNQYEVLVRYNGGSTISWNANMKWTAATAPTLTGTSGKVDVLTFVVSTSDGTNFYLLNTGIKLNVG